MCMTFRKPKLCLSQQGEKEVRILQKTEKEGKAKGYGRDKRTPRSPSLSNDGEPNPEPKIRQQGYRQRHKQ